MKEISHIWTVACIDSVVDQNTHNVSLYNVVEQLHLKIDQKEKTIPKDVMIPFKMQIVSLWRKLPENKKIKATQKITAIDPSGQELGKFEYPFEIASNQRRFRAHVLMENFRVSDKSGDYIFKIEIKEDKGTFEEVAQIPVQVDIEK